jgi:hypothetical protein
MPRIPHPGAMDILPVIALMDSRTATRRRLHGARRDDRMVAAPAAPSQPSRKRSEKATRSTGGAKTGSPSSVTA